MADKVADALRDSMAAIAHMAPESPELQTWAATPRWRRTGVVVFAAAFASVVLVGAVWAVLLGGFGRGTNVVSPGIPPADSSIEVLNAAFTDCPSFSGDRDSALGSLRKVYSWVHVAETGVVVDSEVGPDASPTMTVITADGDEVDVTIHRSYFEGVLWTLSVGGDVWFAIGDPAVFGPSNLVRFVLAFTPDGRAFFPGGCQPRVLYEPLHQLWGNGFDQHLRDAAGKTGTDLDAALGIDPPAADASVEVPIVDREQRDILALLGTILDVEESRVSLTDLKSAVDSARWVAAAPARVAEASYALYTAANTQDGKTDEMTYVDHPVVVLVFEGLEFPRTGAGQPLEEAERVPVTSVNSELVVILDRATGELIRTITHR